ncbi:MAG: hypothetical protein CVU72_01595 [Deltaproteobacteria bacterium HGW-Deltaproteobacteria-7]|jgi:flagellar hook protein FlgE|nr:MAG: hypothetical protein CVU72_01595 [Deltaproteobacteria bacterium HGW-Deltaproteobacteria-7]PKN20789.1 MAG: hypothetical protein CVU71_03140 [Deltaproteobacteria bacterium HGW-Deltaproteobacteria-6]
MGSALWAGISGLNASSKELDVIANNLANVNTVGFKSGTTYFADVLSQSISGGAGGSMQVGRGVAVTEVQTQFGSGSFESTGNATDVAIDGDGFFMVNDDEGATYYTRAGAFHLNSSNMLVDVNNYKVQGKIITNGVPGALGDINLLGAQSEPTATATISLGANLNAATARNGQYNTTQTVYDSLGASHTLNTTFTRTGYTSTVGGYWGLEASLDGNGAVLDIAQGLIFDSNGKLYATYTGTLPAAPTGTAALVSEVGTNYSLDRPGMVHHSASVVVSRAATAGSAWTLGALTDYPYATITSSITGGEQTVKISLDGSDNADITFSGTSATFDSNPGSLTFAIVNTQSVGKRDITIDLSAIALDGNATIGVNGDVNWDMLGDDALEITQYSSASVIRAVTADGYASGQLKTLSIGQDGIISAFFTNGQTTELAQLVLSKFTNPWGLNKLGSNLFGETVTSGSPIQNTPGTSGMGALTPNTLEMSNTDIATEFIKMITSQKAYQASARVVTTQDTIMQELMNLKR